MSDFIKREAGQKRHSMRTVGGKKEHGADLIGEYCFKETGFRINESEKAFTYRR
jgi:hypothetical protein